MRENNRVPPAKSIVLQPSVNNEHNGIGHGQPNAQTKYSEKNLDSADKKSAHTKRKGAVQLSASASPAMPLQAYASRGETSCELGWLTEEGEKKLAEELANLVND